jgi:hypothetical protein
MTELLRSNDAVLISYAAALLDGAGIRSTVFDSNMSIAEGSLGILPRRLMVDDADASWAGRILADAGIGAC